ncbi:hypothetical protein CFBP4996_15355 [Agrobacterium leguminum]|uniref:Uncharacterized protein n=1 Tax=Agrobacterium deltaense NCPPB 1641 TaxID=1183425 RepID=A0A1S7U2D5_9HYPH|nr:MULTISPECIES: hypothetical protein [Agrobacterium]WFS67404.1 hypothetical protein CFBP4996_15355 [Agrobacterium leguminum]CVI61015.1 conserved hypothetical protein [Agrobacterium deltaense NCPPB 1641]
MVSIQSITNMDDKPKVRQTLNLTIRQVSDITGSFNTELGTPKTTIENLKIGPSSVILLSPRNLNAVTANAFVSVIGPGYFEVSHNDAEAIFDYVIVGAV